jgi:hypothetical protein
MVLTNNQIIFQGYGMNTMNKKGIGKKLTTWIYISNSKMDYGLNGEVISHYKNSSEIINAINEWKADAESYSTPIILNPILKNENSK